MTSDPTTLVLTPTMILIFRGLMWVRFKTAKPNQFPTIGKILTTLKSQSLLDILTLLTTLTLQTALTLQSILPIQINSMMLQTRRRLSGTSAVVERGKKQSPKSNQVINSSKYKAVLDSVTLDNFFSHFGFMFDYNFTPGGFLTPPPFSCSYFSVTGKLR